MTLRTPARGRAEWNPALARHWHQNQAAFDPDSEEESPPDILITEASMASSGVGWGLEGEPAAADRAAGIWGRCQQAVPREKAPVQGLVAFQITTYQMHTVGGWTVAPHFGQTSMLDLTTLL